MEINKGRLIVFEGSDGAGKTTQCNLLRQDLIASGKVVFQHHFPSYKTYHGAPVEHFLAGEFGDAGDDSAYFVNALYAVDRAIAWRKILREHFENGETILLDRYTTSSLLYQSAQFDDLDEKKRFIDYVLDFEYNKLGIKEPDQTIFLQLPWELSLRTIIARAKKTGIQRDVFERDVEYIKKISVHRDFVADYLSWDVVECSHGDELLPIEEIHGKVLKMMQKNRR